MGTIDESSMVNRNQQKETLAYFSRHAKDWSRSAQEQTPDRINIVRQRNDYVLHVIQQRQETERALDVGCGAGDLVLEFAKNGISGTGVDFAPEMIRIAVERADQGNFGLAKFHCSSIFDFDMGNHIYDCISANGFIEYISCEELIQFIAEAHRALNPSGSLVLGSRNRLFNLFSMNEFTDQEVEANTTSMLLKEAIAITGSESLDDFLSVDSLPLSTEELGHINTGIDVSMRRQYTPVQLTKLLHEEGFEIVDVYPIHIHGIVPRLKDQYPQVHVEVATLLQAYAKGRRELIAQASSFMVHAIKEDRHE